MFGWLYFWLRFVVVLFKSRRHLLLENAALRHQLLVLSRKTKRPRFRPLGRLSAMVAALLLELHSRQETMLIVVTHNPSLAARFPRRYELRHANLHPAGA